MWKHKIGGYCRVRWHEQIFTQIWAPDCGKSLKIAHLAGFSGLHDLGNLKANEPDKTACYVTALREPWMRVQ